MPPPLPRELIEQILDNIPDKDKQTLARCCLLNKSYTKPLQPRLYRIVSFVLVESGDKDAHYHAQDWRPVDWRLHPSSLALLNTLQRSEQLSDLVEGVRFTSSDEGQCRGVCMGPEHLFSSVLELCTGLQNVELPGYGGEHNGFEAVLSTFSSMLCHYINSRPYLEDQFTALDLRRPQDSMWELLSATQHSLLHLTFSDEEPPWELTEGPPSYLDFTLVLESLHVHSTPPPALSPDLPKTMYDVFTKDSHDTLTTLTIPYTPHLDLSNFTALSELSVLLELDNPAETLGVAPWIRQAPAIRTLTFVDLLGSPMKPLLSPRGPLASLPSTVAVLHLPTDLDNEELLTALSLLNPGTLHTVTYQVRPSAYSWMRKAQPGPPTPATIEAYREKGFCLLRRTEE